MLKIKKGYSFDDLLIIPRSSDVRSRSHVNLKVEMGKGVVLKIPFISANMKTITEDEMAVSIARLGGLGLLHRFDRDDRLIEMFEIANIQTATDEWVGASCGASIRDRELIKKLVDVGCRIISIDVAHGCSSIALEQTNWISEKFPEVLLISGSVATAEGAALVHSAGADVIRGGIGNGSICSTRIQTGCGVPQMTALSDIFDASCPIRSVKEFDSSRQFDILNKKDRTFKIIADGGLRFAGDFVKALTRSDVCMTGSLIAGSNETPGEIKKYAGSSTHKSTHIEGVEGLVENVGPVADIVKGLMEGVASGCSYVGAKDLEELKERAEFVEISVAGLKESHPHKVFKSI